MIRTRPRRRWRAMLAAAVALGAVPAVLAVVHDTPAQARDPLSFRIATFNVLGNAHTQPYAHDDNFAPDRIRAEWMADLLRQLGSPDIIGTQEAEPAQLDDIMRATGGRYEAWPGNTTPNGSRSSLLWRTDVWKAVQKDTITIPFIKYQRQQPVVKLQNLQTGRSIWVISVHNAPRDFQKQRDQALNTEIRKIKELRDTGLPVFIVGDFNEKQHAFCEVVGRTDLRTPMGGSASKSSCSPPDRLMRVDWIFGGADVAFDTFTMDRSPLKRWVNDHAIPVSSVTIP